MRSGAGYASPRQKGALAYLRQIVSRQHKPKYEDKIELVKSNGCLTYRAYSPKMARKLTESQKEMVPISSIAYDWPAENYGVFSKMLRRKNSAATELKCNRSLKCPQAPHC